MPGNHEALKRAIRVARVDHGIRSDRELAEVSGVHLQSLQNWASGRTTPRPSELSKVARVLDVPLDRLMAVYEDRAPETKPLETAVAELTEAVRELVAEIRTERNGHGRKP